MDEAQITDQRPQEGQETAAPKAEEVTFSDGQQKAIDDIISRRIGEVKAKHDAEVRALNEAHKRELARAQMAEEERLKAEQQDAMDALRKRAEDAERSYRLANARTAAVGAGLPAELADALMGADDEETLRNIALVRKAVDERAGALYAERVGKGVPSAPQGATADGWADELRTAMGLPPKGKEKKRDGSRKLFRRD